MFIAFVAIASTDILFALDSIPAVYGVTDEPFIVFAANSFALLGLRALFFLVDGLLDRLISHRRRPPLPDGRDGLVRSFMHG